MDLTRSSVSQAEDRAAVCTDSMGLRPRANASVARGRMTRPRPVY